MRAPDPDPRYVGAMTSRTSPHFLPLGGTGEIGMNLNLYHYDGSWLMVDAGVMFERTAGGGMRILMPEVGFIEQRRDQLAGLVITHAHQDHLGAVADLWPKLRCRVYATPFAAAMLEGPLAERGLRGQVPIQVVTNDARFSVGPFQIERIPLTHSTVEMAALLIDTPDTRILHTGDFKLDSDPVAGDPLARRRLQELGEHGVDVCVSDSTNADEAGWTASEGSVHGPMERLLKQATGRVAVTLFSSNVARVTTLARIAHAVDRELVFAGRSLERTVLAAQKAGYLNDLPPVVPLRHYGYLPPERVLLLCTGSQGERRAALSRIATDEHPAYLAAGDTVMFSARAIPGNELELLRLRTLLEAKELNVITPDDADIHTSGHPCQDELRQLYDWVRPRLVVPTHGTPKKLEAHAALAESMGIRAVRMRNRERLDLGSGKIEGRVLPGRVARG
ncbi:MAG: ribonuclease J [Myxococcota bacterium]